MLAGDRPAGLLNRWGSFGVLGGMTNKSKFKSTKTNDTKQQNGGISPAEQRAYERQGFVPVTIIVVSEIVGIRADSFLTFVKPSADMNAFGRHIQDAYAEMAPGRKVLWLAGYVGNHMLDLPKSIASREQLDAIRANLSGTVLLEGGEMPPATVLSS